jgi:hypothetical protein
MPRSRRLNISWKRNLAEFFADDDSARQWKTSDATGRLKIAARLGVPEKHTAIGEQLTYADVERWLAALPAVVPDFKGETFQAFMNRVVDEKASARLSKTERMSLRAAVWTNGL